MDIRVFEYFLKIADAKSISRVAGELFLSQPALSLKIQKLESDYGQKLFNRSVSGVTLTPAGEALVPYARNLVRLYRQSQDKLAQLQENRAVIRIDASLTLCTWSLPLLVYKLQSAEEFASYYFDMTFSTVESVQDNLLRGISDLGYVQIEKPHPELTHYLVGNDRLVVVANPKADIPERISLSQLTDYPLIYHYDEFGERTPLETTLGRHGLSLDAFRIVMRLHTIETVKTAIYQQLGISFLPHCSVKQQLLSGELREIAVTGFSELYPIYLVYRTESEQDPQMRPLIHYLRRSKISEFC